MFCEKAGKREKKDFLFIDLTFAPFWFLSAASPDCTTRRGGHLFHLFTWIPCANLAPIYHTGTQRESDELRQFCCAFLFEG